MFLFSYSLFYAVLVANRILYDYKQIDLMTVRVNLPSTVFHNGTLVASILSLDFSRPDASPGADGYSI